MEMQKGELLDLSNPRYWRQNAQMAVRDVYDALTEIITNADDRYMLLKPPLGRIEIDVERKKGETPSIIRVRDFADGMTFAVMKKKLQRVSDRVSGMAEGACVRGTNSRGAKDVAILGGVVFESIAGDGCYHKCEITPQGRFLPHGTENKNIKQHREVLQIKEGTGTLVTLLIDSKVVKVPQHDTLRQELQLLVALRDILNSNDRRISLTDVRNNREDILKPSVIEGHDRLSERFAVPGYEGIEAKLTIKRAKQRFDTSDRRPKFRLGGILIKSKHALHGATLFAPELEHDPHAQWFYGRLVCEAIDDFWNQYDDRLEKGLPPVKDNPRLIFDPLRKEGLSREHPFVQALFGEALRRLRPLVELERNQAESKQAHIESDETRRRLRALEKAAAQFMSENRSKNEDETVRDSDSKASDSIFENKGFSLNPPFAQIILGHSIRFWLNIKQAAFPEFSVGDQVEIACLSDEVSASKRFIALEAHPAQEGVLRCIWSVTGEKVTKASGVKARVGSIVVESTVEVLASEKDKYQDIHGFCFQRKRYVIHVGSGKTINLLAPYPNIVSDRTNVDISCSNGNFKISGDKIFTPRPEWGIAICKLKVSTSVSDQSAELTASISGHCCKTHLISIDPAGSAIKIELKDEEQKNHRAYWVRGTNTLHICAKHPSLRRYLGPPDKFPGQEKEYFRVLLAEIVADAICYRILSQKEQTSPEEYTDADWDSYYADYSELMTKFLPIAHNTQVKI